eukprot:6212256-Prorocentrum_lima.AAC.1
MGLTRTNSKNEERRTKNSKERKNEFKRTKNEVEKQNKKKIRENRRTEEQKNTQRLSTPNAPNGSSSSKLREYSSASVPSASVDRRLSIVDLSTPAG